PGALLAKRRHEFRHLPPGAAHRQGRRHPALSARLAGQLVGRLQRNRSPDRQAASRNEVTLLSGVTAGLVPATPIHVAKQCLPKRDRRDRPEIRDNAENQSTRSTSRIGSSSIYDRRSFSISRNRTAMNSSPI